MKEALFKVKEVYQEYFIKSYRESNVYNEYTVKVTWDEYLTFSIVKCNCPMSSSQHVGEHLIKFLQEHTLFVPAKGIETIHAEHTWEEDVLSISTDTGYVQLTAFAIVIDSFHREFLLKVGPIERTDKGLVNLPMTSFRAEVVDVRKHAP